MFTLSSLLSDESIRLAEFPVAREQIFMAHAGVTILPRRVARAMQEYIERACLRHQEFAEAFRQVTETRAIAAGFIGAKATENALAPWPRRAGGGCRRHRVGIRA